MKTLAALFVDKRGAYSALSLIPVVDMWDESRDARKYDGNLPCVAHPPCTRWCRLAGLVEARWGYKQGEDGGCFASALASVRRCGGVLEHPAFSKAWPAHGLSAPPTGGKWVRADDVGGWTCYVEQGRYGHAAKKATWLYANGIVRPELRWGHNADQKSSALVSWCGNKTRRDERRPRLSSKAASATPPEFRDALIRMAMSVYASRAAA